MSSKRISSSSDISSGDSKRGASLAAVRCATCREDHYRPCHDHHNLESITIIMILIIIIVIIIIIIIIIMIRTSHNALTQSGCWPTRPGSQQSQMEGAGPRPEHLGNHHQHHQHHHRSQTCNTLVIIISTIILRHFYKTCPRIIKECFLCFSRIFWPWRYVGCLVIILMKIVMRDNNDDENHLSFIVWWNDCDLSRVGAAPWPTPLLSAPWHLRLPHLPN